MFYITGSNGFIGKKLLVKLSGAVSPIPHQFIQKTRLNPYDSFFFLSSYGNLSSQTDEKEIYKANIEDLLHILKESINKSFRSFVFLSSSSVMLPKQTTYSRSKKAAEEILLAFMEKHNLPVCIIRPFSVIGEGEQEEHLIPTLISAAYSGMQVNLVPNATHDFIDVNDIVDGILNLSNNQARGIFQLGTGIKTTNLQVLKIIEEVTGKKIKYTEISNLRPYDNDNWVSTNFKARSFGWLPKISLRESIEREVENYAFK